MSHRGYYNNNALIELPALFVEGFRDLSGEDPHLWFVATKNGDVEKIETLFANYYYETKNDPKPLVFACPSPFEFFTPLGLALYMRKPNVVQKLLELHRDSGIEGLLSRPCAYKVGFGRGIKVAGQRFDQIFSPLALAVWCAFERIPQYSQTVSPEIEQSKLSIELVRMLLDSGASCYDGICYNKKQATVFNMPIHETEASTECLHPCPAIGEILEDWCSDHPPPEEIAHMKNDNSVKCEIQ